MGEPPGPPVKPRLHSLGATVEGSACPKHVDWPCPTPPTSAPIAQANPSGSFYPNAVDMPAGVARHRRRSQVVHGGACACLHTICAGCGLLAPQSHFARNPTLHCAALHCSALHCTAHRNAMQCNTTRQTQHSTKRRNRVPHIHTRPFCRAHAWFRL